MKTQINAAPVVKGLRNEQLYFIIQSSKVSHDNKGVIKENKSNHGECLQNTHFEQKVLRILPAEFFQTRSRHTSVWRHLYAFVYVFFVSAEVWNAEHVTLWDSTENK